MKTTLRFLLLLLSFQGARAQITTPFIKAGFGVDGELRANIVDRFIQNGVDDWFSDGILGGGQYIIDTTGAAAMRARYLIDPDFRRLPFFRIMRYAPYTSLPPNGRRLLDAVFIRDYHGDDSTIFASGSNKNGMSPANWQCPVSQGIPDKNDILDMMVHVRRAGPNTTDSLWMMGGLSIENTTGNRYFDFEMYQTDIYYDRPSRRFYGYGPDSGHTAWKFDVFGNITTPGDIVFTAEYSSSALSAIEARIWIDRASLAITPTTFNWSGSFDGENNGSQFGYAGITPKTVGDFYSGLTCANNTWAGPFGLIREDNSLVTNYIAGQFMEFSVNLTKLGLDPVTLLGGNACGMPFRRILVKSRASISFTAELKDFVGPFDFFLAPRVDIAADIPVYCGMIGVSELSVTNASSSSVYTWTTTDGHIVGSNTGTTIVVDQPGTYLVEQQLQSGCSTYATDQLAIILDPDCAVLETILSGFQATLNNRKVQLGWTVLQPQGIRYFEVERSTDGQHFTSVGSVPGGSTGGPTGQYSALDQIQEITASIIFYRLKIVGVKGDIKYSKVIRVSATESSKTGISILPNPVIETLQLHISSTGNKKMQLLIYDIAGRQVTSRNSLIQKGNSTIQFSGFTGWQKGVYIVKVQLGDEIFVEKVIVGK